MRNLTPTLFIGASLLVACGGGETPAMIDAMPSIDGPATPDALPAGTVTVVVNSAVAPAQAAHVVVHHGDGTFVSTVDTGTDGRATVNVVQGDSVSVIADPPPGPAGGASVGSIRTILAVEPGDVLNFDPPNVTQPVQTSVAVTFPLLANATSYRVVTPCGSNTGATSPITVSLSGCTQGNIAVIASVPQNQMPTTFSALSAADANFAAPVTLAGTYTARTNIGITLTNVDANLSIDGIDAAILLRNTFATLESGSQTSTIAAGTLTGSIGTFDRPEIDSIYQIAVNRSNALPQFYTSRVAPTANLALNWDDIKVPFVTGEPFFDAKEGRLLWTETGGGSATGGSVQLAIAHDDLANSYFLWEVVGPYQDVTLNNKQFVLPQWPAQYSQFVVQDTDTAYLGTFSTFRFSGGLAPIRSNYFTSGQQVFIFMNEPGTNSTVQRFGNNLRGQGTPSPTKPAITGGLFRFE